jgi:hypothetical protein
MRLRFLTVVLLAALGVAGQSQAPPAVSGHGAGRGQQTIETPHVTVATSVAAGAVAPGARVSLFVDIAPKPKMHVYAPNQKDYIPVTLTLPPNPALQVLPPSFPKPEKYFFAPLKETQLVYSKPFRIVQDITLAAASTLGPAADAAASTLTVTGKLRYQACDDAICYLPKELPVSWTVRIKDVKK